VTASDPYPRGPAQHELCGAALCLALEGIVKSFIGRHRVLTNTDLAELALGVGTDAALWLGDGDEKPKARAARLDAALDILRDDPELAAAVAAVMAAALEEAPDLLGGSPVLVGGAR
jgi:hypothetical protein